MKTCGRGSKINADIRLRRLNLFCHTINTTPSKLISVGKKDVIAIENILLDHVSWLESQNYSPNYIDGILKSIKSWLSFSYVELKRKIRIANAGVPTSIQDEVIPTKETQVSSRCCKPQSKNKHCTDGVFRRVHK